VYVGSLGKGMCAPAIDVTTSDRTPTASMFVFCNRRNEITRLAGRRTKIRAARALEDAPTIVSSRRHNVNLFLRVLSDITRIQLAGLSIEREAPRIPQAKGKDFSAPHSRAKKWVAGRRGVRHGGTLRMVYVDTQDLAEQILRVLRSIVR